MIIADCNYSCLIGGSRWRVPWGDSHGQSTGWRAFEFGGRQMAGWNRESAPPGLLTTRITGTRSQGRQPWPGRERTLITRSQAIRHGAWLFDRWWEPEWLLEGGVLGHGSGPCGDRGGPGVDADACVEGARPCAPVVAGGFCTIASMEQDGESGVCATTGTTPLHDTVRRTRILSWP